METLDKQEIKSDNERILGLVEGLMNQVYGLKDIIHTLDKAVCTADQRIEKLENSINGRG